MKRFFSISMCVMALLFASCEPIEPSLSGVFSVSDSTKVTFSPGNLQYTQSTDTWEFAINQYDMIGENNVKDGKLADKIDLFGWSSSNTTTPFGIGVSVDYRDYSGDFIDWGVNKIGIDAPNTWRTLTANEWNYMVFNRSNADNLKGIAHVSGTNGLILLPDDWECPSGIIFKSGFHSDYSIEAYGQYQTFTTDQWSKLEAAGAVFLPAAGVRYGSDVYDEQNVSNYWSATNYRSNNAYFFFFYSDAAFLNHCSRSYSLSVRLVKDL